MLVSIPILTLEFEEFEEDSWSIFMPLHIITEAKVCAGVKLCYFNIFIALTENRRERKAL